MSAIAGILARDRSAINLESLAVMRAGLRSMGPDSEIVRRAGPVAMLHMAFHTHAASRRGDEHFVAPEGDIVCIDGRLDNPRDVLNGLGQGPRNASFAEIALAVYRRWGTDGFAHLIGDFALALWDASQARLVLACDGMGRRPLYYHVAPDRVYWASKCRPILRAAGLSLRTSEEYFADFLANRTPSGSPFIGIEALHGGQALCVSGSSARVTRYWAFDPSKRIRYRTDDEYASHFADVFQTAVASRLQAEGPVLCELSGGLDSSSIACMGARLVGARAVEAPSMQTLSYVFSKSETADESPFIEIIEAHLAQSTIRVREEDVPLLQPLPALLAPDVPTNGLVFSSQYEAVGRIAQAAGARVVLSGMGGDQAFWSQGDEGLPLADLLMKGHLRELIRQCDNWSRVRRQPFLYTLWRGAVRPLLSPGLQAATYHEMPRAEWLCKEFVRRTRFGERMLPMPDDIGFALPSAARHYGTIRRTMRMSVLEPCMSDSYLDLRYPYLDRRLLDFALAIPVEQIARAHESRSVVRRGLRGYVPAATLNRTSKAGPSEAFLRALSREWSRLSHMLSEPRVADLGVVDRDAFARTLQRARHGIASHESLLLRTISLELWLRTLEDLPQAGETEPPGWRHTIQEGACHDPQDQSVRTA